MNIKPGQRVTSKYDGSRADVLKVSKDGKRVYVEFWTNHSTPKLMRMWHYTSAFIEGAR